MAEPAGTEPDIIWEGQVDFARPREIAVLPIPEEGAVLEISRCETGRCVYVRIRRQREKWPPAQSCQQPD